MALGMIEVFGFVTSIVVADAAAKAADVKIAALDKNKPAAGDAAEVPLIMAVKITGDVAAVEQAVEAGVRVAKERGLYVTHHIISREADDTLLLEPICAVGHDSMNVLEY